MMETKTMRNHPAVSTFYLKLYMPNDHLIYLMRLAKQDRERRIDSACCVILVPDRRELHEIPEVRAFCRRLVSLGFIAYLDLSTRINPIFPQTAASCWGAAEVWLAGENRFHQLPAFPPRDNWQPSIELIDEIEQARQLSNYAAEALLGPLRMQRERKGKT